jgi:hypothetical protein
MRRRRVAGSAGQIWKATDPQRRVANGVIGDGRTRRASICTVLRSPSSPWLRWSTPPYLQLLRGDTPLVAALSVLPLSAALMPTARLAPALVARTSVRTVCAVGLVLAAAVGVVALLGRAGPSSVVSGQPLDTSYSID